MVVSCCAVGCQNRHSVETRATIKFYRFPKNYERRGRWIAACRRDKWEPNEYTRICSRHFISGAKSDDPLSPDYVPSLFSFTKSPVKRKATATALRYKERQAAKRRRLANHQRMEAAIALRNLSSGFVEVTSGEDMPNVSATSTVCDVAKSISTQTDINVNNLTAIEKELDDLRVENMNLKQRLADLSTDEESFRGNDRKVRNLLGLPSFSMLMAVFAASSPFIQNRSSLTLFQQFILCLMRLRHNLSLDFLAFYFNVSASTVSRTFQNVIDVCDTRLVPALVFWPQRDQLKLTMPASFRDKFEYCISIIDCFEIFIERPSDLKARAQTYSDYKSHNTMKYLIGITPQGVITFISKGWGGRASDKYVTENCGYFDNLRTGDVVMADRGFNIADSLALHSATLEIPVFTKGKKQLDPVDVEFSRNLSSLRIHVERVIGLTRQKFTILEGTIPITLLRVDESKTLTTLDKIVRVCCALTNLSPSVVPFD